MTVVIDASVVFAALLDTGAAGPWAEQVLGAGPLAAPHHLPVEVANVLRRSVLSADITADTASLAYEDLLALRVELFPYGPCAARAWELRSNIAPYDEWYIALAESLGARMATLDARLRRAKGPRCEFLLPPE